MQRGNEIVSLAREGEHKDPARVWCGGASFEVVCVWSPLEFGRVSRLEMGTQKGFRAPGQPPITLASLHSQATGSREL